MALNRRKRRAERRDITVRNVHARYEVAINSLTGRYQIVRWFGNSLDPRVSILPKSMVPEWLIGMGEVSTKV